MTCFVCVAFVTLTSLVSKGFFTQNGLCHFKIVTCLDHVHFVTWTSIQTSFGPLDFVTPNFLGLIL